MMLMKKAKRSAMGLEPVEEPKIVAKGWTRKAIQSLSYELGKKKKSKEKYPRTEPIAVLRTQKTLFTTSLFCY